MDDLINVATAHWMGSFREGDFETIERIIRNQEDYYGALRTIIHLATNRILSDCSAHLETASYNVSILGDDDDVNEDTQTDISGDLADAKEGLEAVKELLEKC